MAKDYKKLLPSLDMSRLPRHVGIIMDGNGRWAKQHSRPRLYGHREGAKSIRQVVELGVELGLKYLTFYAFSTENWNRPEDEVKGLLKLLKEKLIKEIPELNEQNIYVQFIGSEINLEAEYLAEIRAVAAKTHQNTGMVVNIAFNYGGRLEIIEAIKKLKPEDVNSLGPDNFGQYLWTKGQPDPDLIIRSSGEKRLSNFLLWQSAYSEIYITETLWPDFGKVEMIKALQDYQSRNRRYGGLG
ncbi:MAG: di-trans,poly-cis-decaprenylcistransferase [Candidatus Cloacimonetes bacterium]|jgi:undecaprenyl diphosphate synthase|nr:di-trans,poly-cis-decaprenylcistransferase [Candidatus Cloacimonadota bacterium]MCB5286462.1 di-trans,poly-cis-decaprenylcistransferase [Candidatus Cloacimonadota bacterium]MCK9185005.1 polyprenyl diphosphate synthase [Candidatus Cloacimonadota bacterium]MCK9583496.1 polyprenyl diphosphate synthase [Candidatus Cloacimonadota bacterium]MDY0228784.1 polyprenyl diphosphate synthase [Candidatus Cloacimonadaceae bacterium]